MDLMLPRKMDPTSTSARCHLLECLAPLVSLVSLGLGILVKTLKGVNEVEAAGALSNTRHKKLNTG